jgi:hypothetical protein
MLSHVLEVREHPSCSVSAFEIVVVRLAGYQVALKVLGTR